MSTNVQANLLKNFVIKTIGNDLTAKEAQKLGLEDEYKTVSEELDVNSIDLNDVLEDTDLYEQFATMYVAEQEKKAEAKDKEKQKEEQTQVKDKNGAGV